MSIHRKKSALCQLFRKKRSYHFRLFHAYNRIDYRVIEIHADQILSQLLCLTGSGLHRGHINVIIDMGVVGCIMSRHNFQRDIGSCCFDFYIFVLHKNAPFMNEVSL